MPKYFAVFEHSFGEECKNRTALLIASSIREAEKNLRRCLTSKLKGHKIHILYVRKVNFDFTEEENPSKRG